MNLFSLSSAYLRVNPLNTLLNLLLLTLGMGTIVLLLLFSQQLGEKLLQDAHGIDLVVGAKGSPLQLILSSIYHADVPTGNIPLSEVHALTTHKLVKTAIPLALGDSYHGYRIVGTTPAYPAHYEADLAQGRLWEKSLEATLGAEVARQTGLDIGAHFVGAHGLMRGTDVGEHLHESHEYTVVGILKPTDTIIDHLVLTAIETVWEVHEAQHEHEDETRGHEHESEGLKVDTEHEITALLIQYQSPLAAASLPRQVNSQSALQAASPALETVRLLELVGFGTSTLRLFGILLIIVAVLNIFVTLYHTLAERCYDLAIMRTLGASKMRLLWQLLFEGILMTFLGTLLGFLWGHSMASLLGTWLNQTQQLHLTGWTYVSQEYGLLGLALLIGIVSALIPAIQAYRTDIARILSRG